MFPRKRGSKSRTDRESITSVEGLAPSECGYGASTEPYRTGTPSLSNEILPGQRKRFKKRAEATRQLSRVAWKDLRQAIAGDLGEKESELGV